MAALAGTTRKVTVECPACGDDIDVEVTFRRVIHTYVDDDAAQVKMTMAASVDFDPVVTGHAECFEATQETVDAVLALEAEFAEDGN